MKNLLQKFKENAGLLDKAAYTTGFLMTTAIMTNCIVVPMLLGTGILGITVGLGGILGVGAIGATTLSVLNKSSKGNRRGDNRQLILQKSRNGMTSAAIVILAIAACGFASGLIPMPPQTSNIQHQSSTPSNAEPRPSKIPSTLIISIKNFS